MSKETSIPERDDFLQGVCVALQVIRLNCAVTWREIVEAVGVDQMLNYAAFIEPDEWELAGFKMHAKSELRRMKPRKRLVTNKDTLIKAMAISYAKERAEEDAKKDAIRAKGICPECDGEGEQGGQFSGGSWTCEACNGTGKYEAVP